MLAELIIFIIFILSFAGVLFIIVRKLPVLNSLPQNGTTGIKKHQIILDAENKLKEILISFEKQIWLHKFLSWVKIITLKIEIRVDMMLHRIRKKAQQIDKDLKEKK